MDEINFDEITFASNDTTHFILTGELRGVYFWGKKTIGHVTLVAITKTIILVPYLFYLDYIPGAISLSEVNESNLKTSHL